MRVRSTLADIDFRIGRIERSGDNLVIESDPDSTVETRIIVTPRDLAQSLVRLLSSGTTWRYLLALPWRLLRARRAAVATDAWEARRRRTGLNKPW